MSATCSPWYGEACREPFQILLLCSSTVLRTPCLLVKGILAGVFWLSQCSSCRVPDLSRCMLLTLEITDTGSPPFLQALSHLKVFQIVWTMSPVQTLTNFWRTMCSLSFDSPYFVTLLFLLCLLCLYPGCLQLRAESYDHVTKIEHWFTVDFPHLVYVYKTETESVSSNILFFHLT